jgi:hypothetical protein
MPRLLRQRSPRESRPSRLRNAKLLELRDARDSLPLLALDPRVTKAFHLRSAQLPK